MPITLYESGASEEKKKALPQTSIVPGVVQNNCDLIVQGKVLVRIPSLNQEVWARMAANGAGKNTGMFHAPNMKDEVLVALVHSDPADAYIIGGLWSTSAPPPISPLPTNVPTKRVIRTGVGGTGVGHEVEFDDALQSITITTSLTPTGQQKIKMDPTGITMQNTAGTVKITLDNLTQRVLVSATTGIELSAQTYIKLSAAAIDIEATGLCVLSGKPVKIN